MNEDQALLGDGQHQLSSDQNNQSHLQYDQYELLNIDPPEVTVASCHNGDEQPSTSDSQQCLMNAMQISRSNDYLGPNPQRIVIEPNFYPGNLVYQVDGGGCVVLDRPSIESPGLLNPCRTNLNSLAMVSNSRHEMDYRDDALARDAYQIEMNISQNNQEFESDLNDVSPVEKFWLEKKTIVNRETTFTVIRELCTRSGEVLSSEPIKSTVKNEREGFEISKTKITPDQFNRWGINSTAVNDETVVDRSVTPSFQAIEPASSPTKSLEERKQSSATDDDLPVMRTNDLTQRAALKRKASTSQATTKPTQSNNDKKAQEPKLSRKRFLSQRYQSVDDETSKDSDSDHVIRTRNRFSLQSDSTDGNTPRRKPSVRKPSSSKRLPSIPRSHRPRRSAKEDDTKPEMSGIRITRRRIKSSNSISASAITEVPIKLEKIEQDYSFLVKPCMIELRRLSPTTIAAMTRMRTLPRRSNNNHKANNSSNSSSIEISQLRPKRAKLTPKSKQRSKTPTKKRTAQPPGLPWEGEYRAMFSNSNQSIAGDDDVFNKENQCKSEPESKSSSTESSEITIIDSSSGTTTRRVMMRRSMTLNKSPQSLPHTPQKQLLPPATP